MIFVSPPNLIKAGVNRGGYACYFRDPDGITLELVQPPAHRMPSMNAAIPLRDATVVVTGAAGGIGRALAERLVREGTRVVAVDRDEAGLAGLEQCERVVCDLTTREGRARVTAAERRRRTS